MAASGKQESKSSDTKYFAPPDKDIWKIICPLLIKKEKTGYEIAVAVLYDGKNFEIIKSYFSHPADANHPLDTPIANLMLHACQDFNRKLFIVATCEPTVFEYEAINVLSIDRVFYLTTEKKFVQLVQKNRSLGKKLFTIPQNVSLQLEATNLINDVHAAIEKADVKASEKGRLNTRDSFLWCENLKPADCHQGIQNELYMGLLYSSLFILWNETARPISHSGRFPVAAMLLDGDNKPIAFSINTSKADNSLAHAETGMLLRYFNNNKVKSLPANSKLYSTLESCEMCRAGLSLAKENKSEFKELYGKKDNKVKCEAYASYSLSPHPPSNEHLKNIDLKHGNKFYDFCRANYLAMKSFLENADLKASFPKLLENIQILWNQVLAMRMTHWVGNPILYDSQDDPTDPAMVIVKQKSNCKELLEYYYGSKISELIIKEKEIHANGKTQIKGQIQMGNFLHTASSAGTAHIKNCIFKSNLPQTIKIPKDSIKNQLVCTGFPLDEKKLIGDYKSSTEDERLKKELFPLSATEQITAASVRSRSAGIIDLLSLAVETTVTVSPEPVASTRLG